MNIQNFKSYYIDDDVVLLDDIRPFEKSGSIYMRNNVIAYCIKGRMTADYKGSHIEMREHQLFICPPSALLSNVMITSDFKILAMGITTNALQQYLREYMSIWNQFTYIEKMCVLPLNSTEWSAFYENIYTILSMILSLKTDDDDVRYRTEMLKSLFRIILMALCNLLRKQPAADTEVLNQKTSLFTKFLDLLQNTKCKHKTVQFYASELCISTKYLSLICKKNSDKTANQWIKEFLMADITNYLRESDLSIKEIAARVGFENASFFGKYVKENFGCTPMEYRNK